MRNLKRFTRRQALWLLAGALLGCAIKPTATSLPTRKPEEPTATPVDTRKPEEPTVTRPAPTRVSATGLGYPIAALKVSGFAAVRPESLTIKPNVRAYKTDPRSALNQDVMLSRLTPAQLQALEEVGFAIVPTGEKQIYDIYIHAKNASLPVFVTTDALLHTFHVLYDYALRRVEYDHFVADLKALLQTMLDESEAQAKDASSLKAVAEAAGGADRETRPQHLLEEGLEHGRQGAEPERVEDHDVLGAPDRLLAGAQRGGRLRRLPLGLAAQEGDFERGDGDALHSNPRHNGRVGDCARLLGSCNRWWCAFWFVRDWHGCCRDALDSRDYAGERCLRAGGR